ncbi:MAG: peptide chain release factor 2 [Clostridiales bacterium]|jgi:peptide chain release factor 2|nr:peptide chain release factor 2 [Clostridiales bacterium]
MLTTDDYKQRIKALTQKLDGCCEAFDVKKLQARSAELDELLQSPGLFSDVKRAAAAGAEAKYVKDKLDELRVYRARLDDLSAMIELIEDGEDGFYDELCAETEALAGDVETLHLETLLKGDYDNKNAILMLQAGAGGTEAQDWVSMLYRMYRMYAENNRFAVEELDYLAGDVAGIKQVSFLVRGVNAYGYLKAEKGVHRLVRISPFDSNARRHTSFASLEVMPEIENDTSVEIRPEDLKVDTYRSGGAGGQHVNKTDSAVRITHLPTGIVVQCQNERSQIQNRETAMKMLTGKLVERKISENLEKAQSIKGDIKKIEWGSQIRSYVFQPYTMVKDHRTGFETGDVQAVMDGKIEGFIFDYLRKS